MQCGEAIINVVFHCVLCVFAALRDIFTCLDFILPYDRMAHKAENFGGSGGGGPPINAVQVVTPYFGVARFRCGGTPAWTANPSNRFAIHCVTRQEAEG